MTLNFEALRKVKGNPSAETAPGRRLKLGSREEYSYDMPKELIGTILAQFPLDSWVKAMGESDENFLTRRGQEFMQYLINQADSDEFRDRTAEMIEIVAQQTGISFPHRFERYMELGILTLRPRDAWNVAEATTKRLKIRSYNCSLQKILADRGIDSCQSFCLTCAATVAHKISENLDYAQTKESHTDGYCVLTFRRE